MTEIVVFSFEEKQQTANTNESSYKRLIEYVRRSFPLIFPGDIKRAHIILRTNLHEIKLMIDLTTFELTGYQNSDCWFTLFQLPASTLPQRQMDVPPSSTKTVGPTLLKLDRCYSGWASLICKETDLGSINRMMASIRLGQKQLVTAINLLAASENKQDMAWSLIVLRLMICEGIRFERVSNHLTATYFDSQPSPPWMLELVRRHEHDEAIRLYIDDDGLGRDYHRGRWEIPLKWPQENDVDSDSDTRVENIVDTDGILDSDSWDSDELQIDFHDAVPCPDVRVEVFSVRINNINGEQSGKFYGTISVRSNGMECVYRRKEEESDFMRSGETILLTRPRKAKLAYGDYMGIDLALIGEKTSCNRYYYGQIYWLTYDTSCVRDEPVYEKFDGKYCSVTVNYILLCRATEACIQVTVVDGGRRNALHVYGQISVRCGSFDCESILFQKKAKDHAVVCGGEPIKLSKSLVSAPWDSPLVVRVELYDYQEDHSFDDEVAVGIAEFSDPLSGSMEKSISSHIMVRVTWK